VFGGPGITSWNIVCCCCVEMSCACTSTLRIPTVLLSSTSHITAHKATAKSNTNLMTGPPVSMPHLKMGLLLQNKGLHHPNLQMCQSRELLRAQTLQRDCAFARAVAWGGTWGGLAAFPPAIPEWSSCFQSFFLTNFFSFSHKLKVHRLSCRAQHLDA